MEVKILSQDGGMAEAEVKIPGAELTHSIDQTMKGNKAAAGADRDNLLASNSGKQIFQQAVRDLFTDNWEDILSSIDLPVASQPKVTVEEASEDGGVRYTFTFALKPAVTLGTYKGIHVPCPDYRLTEEEVEEEVKKAEAKQGTMDLRQRQEFRQKLANEKKAAADRAIEDYVFRKILEEAQMDIPDAMIESEANACMADFASQLAAHQMTIDEFCDRSGKTPEQMREEMMPLAKRQLQLRLVLEAIADAEELEAEEEDFTSYWEQAAKQYGMTPAQLKAYAGQEVEAQARADIRSRKAYMLLRENTILEFPEGLRPEE